MEWLLLLVIVLVFILGLSVGGIYVDYKYSLGEWNNEHSND